MAHADQLSLRYNCKNDCPDGLSTYVHTFICNIELLFYLPSLGYLMELDPITYTFVVTDLQFYIL